MSKPATVHASAPTTVAPPDDLASTLAGAGFAASLVVTRADGSPLSDADRKLLHTVLTGYALAREVNPTDDELADAVVAYERKLASGQ